jgi:hypothetical protein
MTTLGTCVICLEEGNDRMLLSPCGSCNNFRCHEHCFTQFQACRYARRCPTCRQSLVHPPSSPSLHTTNLQNCAHRFLFCIMITSAFTCVMYLLLVSVSLSLKDPPAWLLSFMHFLVVLLATLVGVLSLLSICHKINAMC